MMEKYLWGVFLYIIVLLMTVLAQRLYLDIRFRFEYVTVVRAYRNMPNFTCLIVKTWNYKAVQKNTAFSAKMIRIWIADKNTNVTFKSRLPSKFSSDTDCLHFACRVGHWWVLKWVYTSFVCVLVWARPSFLLVSRLVMILLTVFVL